MVVVIMVVLVIAIVLVVVLIVFKIIVVVVKVVIVVVNINCSCMSPIIICLECHQMGTFSENLTCSTVTVISNDISLHVQIMDVLPIMAILLT